MDQTGTNRKKQTRMNGGKKMQNAEARIEMGGYGKKAEGVRGRVR
jgi:hypothetical protein